MTQDNNAMHAKPGLRVVLEWKIAGSGSVIADVITLNNVNEKFTTLNHHATPSEGIEMSWWKFRKEPQYKTQRALAVIFAVFALIGLWASIPMMQEGFVSGYFWIAFAVVSAFSAISSFRSYKNETKSQME